jgi:hypothetical protein
MSDLHDMELADTIEAERLRRDARYRRVRAACTGDGTIDMDRHAARIVRTLNHLEHTKGPDRPASSGSGRDDLGRKETHTT